MLDKSILAPDKSMLLERSAYMYLMLDEAKKNNISLTRESFQKFGKDVDRKSTRLNSSHRT